MAITYYRYDDASAPTLTGEVGSLVNLLDKCLVTGYGSKAAAGWTKPYTGANKAVFRMATGAGKNGHYLRVLDDGTSAIGAARTADILGFTAMTTVDAGSGKFPQTTQLAATYVGLAFVKSDTLSNVQRPWLLVADDTAFYLIGWQTATTMVNNHIGAASRHSHFCFGQFYSYKTSETNNTVIWGKNNSTYTDTSGYSEGARMSGSSSYTANNRTFMAKDYMGLRESVNGALANSGFHSGANTTPVGQVSFPNPMTGDIDYSPNLITERDYFTATAYVHMRGKMPFLYGFDAAAPDVTSTTQPTFIRMFDVLTGAGADAGKTFLVTHHYSGSNAYPVLLQISGSRS
jgi:hypothetical protein